MFVSGDYLTGRRALLLTATVLLASCAYVPLNDQGDRSASAGSAQQSRYARSQDTAPLLPLDPAKIQDAVPRTEPRLAAGNKSPYTINGKTYRVMSDASGYREQGMASWYGTKFHGHQTSNGERYSLFGMTAAHKTLPIPSYVRVTNLENGLSTIVRVNDRGPFHGDRIIDLSYAAATKIGYASKGTAWVHVEVIDPQQYEAGQRRQQLVSAAQPDSSGKPDNSQAAESPQEPVAARYTLQAGAFQDAKKAQLLRDKLISLLRLDVRVAEESPWYRVQVGPVAKAQVDPVRTLMLSANVGINAVVVRASCGPGPEAVEACL